MWSQDTSPIHLAIPEAATSTMGDKHENPVSGYYVILYPDPMFKHGFGEAKVGVNKEIPGSNTKILGTLFSNKPI